VGKYGYSNDVANVLNKGLSLYKGAAYGSLVTLEIYDSEINAHEGCVWRELS